MSAELILRCPVCKKPVPWKPASVYRPFCSQRCQQIDLGDWAAENHRIAGDPLDAAPDLDDGD